MNGREIGSDRDRKSKVERGGGVQWSWGGGMNTLFWGPKGLRSGALGRGGGCLALGVVDLTPGLL